MANEDRALSYRSRSSDARVKEDGPGQRVNKDVARIERIVSNLGLGLGMKPAGDGCRSDGAAEKTNESRHSQNEPPVRDAWIAVRSGHID